MPGYELLTIFKAFERPELIKTIKRSAEYILARGGIIQSFENMGYQQLPYRIRKKDGFHTHGNYILIKFYATTPKIREIQSEFVKDIDLIRATLAPLKEYDESFRSECPCKEEGQFKKDQVDYMRPVTVWNKRQIHKDYSVRL